MIFNANLYIVFILSFMGGIIAVFTPYVYNMIPITLQNLSNNDTLARRSRLNTMYYCTSIFYIFTALGVLVSFILDQKQLIKHIPLWVSNLFFFRLFAGLGISFLGAFDILLPKAWKKQTHSKATIEKRSVFLMALRLPLVSFSSTAPIVCLVLLLAGKTGYAGTTIGMAGFATGLIVPFIYPRFINILSPTVLNNVKVLLGFISLMLALRFLSNTDMALGWNIIDRNTYIAILCLLTLLIGLYMLGMFNLSNDYLPMQNIYGVTYVPIVRLFIAIAALAFVVYLIPGLWGAPLKSISAYLPQVKK